jgi:hypothetical protein
MFGAKGNQFLTYLMLAVMDSYFAQKISLDCKHGTL